MVVDRTESARPITEAAVEDPNRRILVDLAAQTHEPLVRWMDESAVLDLADELGIEIQYWHVMDTGRDSVDLLRRLLDRFGTSLKYVLVRNPCAAATSPRSNNRASRPARSAWARRSCR